MGEFEYFIDVTERGKLAAASPAEKADGAFWTPLIDLKPCRLLFVAFASKQLISRTSFVLVN